MRINQLIVAILTTALSFLSGTTTGAQGVVTGLAPRPFDEDIVFIESLRGIEFPREVAHRSIHRAELREFLRQTWERDLPISSTDYFGVLASLHLIDADTGDPLRSLLDLYVSQILAFYDPIDDIFYSIDEAPDSSLDAMSEVVERAVTIHELVHALQDQKFDAGERLEGLVDDWDATLAYHALIEGEATLVMLTALVEDSGGSIDDVVEDGGIASVLGVAAGLELSGDGMPRYFVESMKFPYLAGLSYVIRLYRQGGWKAIEAAHAAPPTSTEVIYGGKRGAANVAPRLLGVPDAILETTLGEFHWRFLLGEGSADGWKGDRVAILRSDGGMTVLAVTSWDSEESSRRFATAYGDFLRENGSDPVIRTDDTDVIVAYGPDKALAEDLVGRQSIRDERRGIERSTPR